MSERIITKEANLAEPAGTETDSFIETTGSTPVRTQIIHIEPRPAGIFSKYHYEQEQGSVEVEMRQADLRRVSPDGECRLFTSGLMGCTGIACIGIEADGNRVVGLQHASPLQAMYGEVIVPEGEFVSGKAVIMTVGRGEPFRASDIDGALDRLKKPEEVCYLCDKYTGVVGAENVIVVPFDDSWDDLAEREAANAYLHTLVIDVSRENAVIEADGRYAV